ncbi:MAG: holo-ACP synthase [Planctomycetota bacterium]|nr:holo-ACP synthase [Planctomycetota bacterium]
MALPAPRIGQDLVAVGRFRQALGRQGAGFERRVFTASEWAWSASKADPAPYLAACFAAKEAAFKALGSGWGQGVAWRDVEVVSEGRELRLAGRAAAIAAESDLELSVSLAHTAETAIAMVVAQPSA